MQRLCKFLKLSLTSLTFYVIIKEKSRGDFMIKNFDTHFDNSINKCGAITCIHNVDGYCNADNCDVYERTLKQEH